MANVSTRIALMAAVGAVAATAVPAPPQPPMLSRGVVSSGGRHSHNNSIYTKNKKATSKRRRQLEKQGRRNARKC